jgi:hypothetical protein
VWCMGSRSGSGCTSRSGKDLEYRAGGDGGLPWRYANTSWGALVGLLRPVTSLELQHLDIRCQIGQRRTHGLSAVPQLPPTPPPAQNLPPGAVAPACRRGGRQLGTRCRSLVVEREDPATHSRHTRSRLLAEPGAVSAPVVDRRTAPVAGCPRSTAGGRGRSIETLPREASTTSWSPGPPPRHSAAGIRRALHRSPAAAVAASPAARRSHPLTLRPRISTSLAASNRTNSASQLSTRASVT